MYILPKGPNCTEKQEHSKDNGGPGFDDIEEPEPSDIDGPGFDDVIIVLSTGS